MTWPAISPAVRLRCRPSLAVRQNWQLTAQPTWLETQMVARLAAGRARSWPGRDSLGCAQAHRCRRRLRRRPLRASRRFPRFDRPGRRPASDQVAFSAVHRLEDLRDCGPADVPAFVGQPSAQRLGQRGNLVELRNSLTIEGFRQLSARQAGSPPPPSAPPGPQHPGQRAARGLGPAAAAASNGRVGSDLSGSRLAQDRAFPASDRAACTVKAQHGCHCSGLRVLTTVAVALLPYNRIRT